MVTNGRMGLEWCGGVRTGIERQVWWGEVRLGEDWIGKVRKRTAGGVRHGLVRCGRVRTG